ncbi:MAG: nitrate ABC transporter permease [Williamsia sp.]|nr:nitrate ABC transporter permease [Williamsia sp.]
MKHIFRPFGRVDRTTLAIMIVGQIILALLFWHLTSNGLIPKPLQVGKALGALLFSRLLWDNIIISVLLTVKAMAIAVIITLFFSYLSVLPFFHTIARFLVKCRYLTLTGFIFIFTLLTQNGGQLKLSLLIFGIVPFFVTSFLAVIISTERQQYELCKTLGYTNWETLYEVVIVGKADQVFEIVRQNFAISWLMITLVEGYSMGEGGIGTLLIKYNKYNDLTNVISIQIVIFLLGLLFDYLLGTLKVWFLPYSKFESQPL